MKRTSAFDWFPEDARVFKNVHSNKYIERKGVDDDKNNAT
jgi:hypothetical protein